jgi:hypothetical protein
MSLIELLRKSVTLDGCATKEVKKPKEAGSKTAFDDVGEDEAENYTIKDLKLRSAGAIASWCETDELDSDESAADRLQLLFVGIVDIDKDGELSSEEGDLLEILLNYAWDYLSTQGVDDDSISNLLNDWDSEAADRVMDLLNGSMPDGDDSIDNFAFGPDDQSAVFDAVYKKRMVVRDGHKMRVNKRISGHIKLSSNQKVAVRKMQMKSHSASAMMHRRRSMKIRKNSGL